MPDRWNASEFQPAGGTPRGQRVASMRAALASLLILFAIFPRVASAQDAISAADESQWQRASALFARGLYWESEAEFRALSERLPKLAKVHFGLGAALARSERPRAALKALDRALELDLKDPQAHLIRAGVLETLGSVDEAEKAYRSGLELAPDHAELRLRFGIYLHRRSAGASEQRLKRAARELDRALALRPRHAETLYERAALAFRGQDYERARSLATAAVKADARLPSARYLLSQIAAREKKIDEAKRHAAIFRDLRQKQVAEQRAQQTARARVGLGYRALRARDAKAAAAYFASALDARPGDAQARAGLQSLQRQLAAGSTLHQQVSSRLDLDARQTRGEKK
jgi:Tfp pilus assembly protein PilF